jgi:hypothetical protein
MFIATKCPYSNAYNDRMKKMADEYAARGVQFVGINSNVSEPADEVQKHGKEHGFAFPLMKDPGNKVADMYDARRTPRCSWSMRRQGPLPRPHRRELRGRVEGHLARSAQRARRAARRPAGQEHGDEGVRLHDQACVGFSFRTRPS